MLGNLKELISVVQDGLASNNNLRQTFQDVKNATHLFKEKQKVSTESKVNYGAGGELLEKYQEDWVAIHDNADKNAKAAEDVDKLITELHDMMKLKLQSAQEMSQNLAYIPTLTATVAEVMDSLKNVHNLLETVEEELVEFEDIVERSKMENWKLDHHYQLTIYKEKKMAGLEGVRNKFATEKLYERERQQLAELQELQVRRDTSNVAFQNDVAKYLASGTVATPAAAGQPSPKVTLEQIQLDDDKTDLENFLDS